MKRAYSAIVNVENEDEVEEVEEEDDVVEVVSESPPHRQPPIPTGRRARRKFCSSCVDYFSTHFNDLFPEPVQPEFLQNFIHNYVVSAVIVDFSSSSADIERIATNCMMQLQNKQESTEWTSVDNDVHTVRDDDEVSEDVEFVAHTSSTSSHAYMDNSAQGILSAVLNIYPDAAPAFVTALIDTHCYADLSSPGAPSLQCYSHDAFQKVVTEMSEKGYDKAPRHQQTAPPPPSSRNCSGSSSATGGFGAQIVYSRDFASTSWETDPEYRSRAMMLLQNDFPFLKVQSLQHFFAKEGHHHYYPTVQALEALLRFPRQPPQQRKLSSAAASRQCLHALEDCATALKEAQLVTKKTWKNIPFLFDEGLGGQRGQPLGELLEEECHFLHTREVARRETQDREAAELLNEEEARREGSLLECGCCCGEYAFEALVQCSEGHLFCRTCLKSYIENTLFGSGKTRLACMSSAAGEPCPGTYLERFVAAALPPLVYRKYQDAVAQEAIQAANIEGLLQCHACGYQAELSSDAGSVLTCPSCTQQTCRFCKEEAHIPLRCSEVEKKSVTSLRVNVEEAMSEARIRECPNPKCKQRFYKTEGCNKMSCACGRKICYQCRKDITHVGYQHFCSAPHCSHKDCGRCVLFTDSVADDRQAMYEAGLKKMDEAPLESGEKSGSGSGEGASGSGPAVDLDSLLEGGSLAAKKKPRITHYPAPVAAPGLFPRAVAPPAVPFPRVMRRRGWRGRR